MPRKRYIEDGEMAEQANQASDNETSQEVGRSINDESQAAG